MVVEVPGKIYTLATAKGNTQPLVFCHHNEAKEFIDGITSEELIQALIDRHHGFMQAIDTEENINIYTHLKQVSFWLSQRGKKKLIRKNRVVQNDR